jgi:hypothetical protein
MAGDVNRFGTTAHPLPGVEEVLRASQRAERARRQARAARRSAASRMDRYRDARRRCMKLFLRAVRTNQDARNRFCDTEDRMERAAEEYRRAVLLGADLPPMSTIEVTVDTVRIPGGADRGD